MSTVWIILAMGAGVYALRLAGLVLPGAAVPAGWDRALTFVPIALLTALAVVSLVSQGDGLAMRLAAATGGTLVAFQTRQMWACIASGMLLYWLLSTG